MVLESLKVQQSLIIFWQVDGERLGYLAGTLKTAEVLNCLSLGYLLGPLDFVPMAKNRVSDFP